MAWLPTSVRERVWGAKFLEGLPVSGAVTAGPVRKQLLQWQDAWKVVVLWTGRMIAVTAIHHGSCLTRSSGFSPLLGVGKALWVGNGDWSDHRIYGTQAKFCSGPCLPQDRC